MRHFINEHTCFSRLNRGFVTVPRLKHWLPRLMEVLLVLLISWVDTFDKNSAAILPRRFYLLHYSSYIYISIYKTFSFLSTPLWTNLAVVMCVWAHCISHLDWAKCGIPFFALCFHSNRFVGRTNEVPLAIAGSTTMNQGHHN